MHRHSLLDELRRIEHEVVEGERQAAELEAQLVALKRKNGDLSEARAAKRYANTSSVESKTASVSFRCCTPSKLEPSTPPDVRGGN